MKTVSSLKTNKNVESPKTPGGISKSLLTPCRRVGLSRNWRKSGPSPFVSPLSGCAEIKQECTASARKRKQLCDEGEAVKDQNDDFSQSSSENNIAKCSDIDTTPSRNVILPHRKKSKTFVTSNIAKDVTKSPDQIDSLNTKVVPAKVEKERKEEVVTTPISIKSKSRSKKLIVSLDNEDTQIQEEVKENFESKIKPQPKNDKQKSPENLTKECIVVIQKKIFKKDLVKLEKSNVKNKEGNVVSQALFDSDTDDVPLSTLNKDDGKLNVEPTKKNLEEDDDFAENTKVIVKKLEDKTTSTGGLRNRKDKKKSNRELIKKSACLEYKPDSQCSFDDDEDFVTDKRTILIKKTYSKVTKPLKAKSTGSITQKDIDELKARIEMKKKLLLAKAMTKDTEELRNLIKKWQKGCQDALMDLMELMKRQFPDKQNMDYAEILQTLKIPAAMVGYDEENDSFITPTDENIVLSKFNDL